MSSIPETKFQVEGTQQQDEVSIDSYDDLQNVCDYRLAFKGQKINAVVSLLFGVFAFGAGVLGYQQSIIGVFLLLLGFLLIVDGLGLLLVRSLNVLLLDAVAFCTLGIWNVAVTAMDLAAGYGDGSRWILIGLFQVGWGFKSFTKYRALSKIPEPGPALIKHVDELLNDVIHAKDHERGDIIEFQIVGFRDRQNWKGRLCGDLGIFVMGGGKEGVFAEKEKIEIVPQGKPKSNGRMKASFRFRDHSGNGTISLVHYTRFQTWFEQGQSQLCEEPGSAPQEA